MSKSYIFDDYAKIAEEAGLISNAEDAPKESAKLRKYKKSPYPRVGSDDISTIEALYGVKPDATVKYEFNIMEAAHPKPVVVAPSYDRLNGLVENNIERQNIMSNIALKPTDGNLTNKKYAKKELMMELIRVANFLDSSDNELCSLADACINDLTEKKTLKTAALPIVLIGAAALAGIWLWSHLDDPDRGLVNNLNNAIEQLNDLKETSWYESAVDETVQRDADALLFKLNQLQSHVQEFSAAIDSVYNPKSLDDADEVNKLNASLRNNPQVSDNVKAFVELLDSTLRDIIVAINKFSSSYYQKMHTNPSWIENISGWAAEALHGRWGLIANDFISAVNALKTLERSIKEALNLANNFDRVAAQNKEKLESELGTPRSAPETETTEDEEASEKSEESDYSDMFRMMGISPTEKQIEFLKSLK